MLPSSDLGIYLESPSNNHDNDLVEKQLVISSVHYRET